MNNLLSFKFWLATRPPALLPIYQKIFFAIIIIFILLFFISWFLGKKGGIYRKIWNRINAFSLSNALLGLVILFFNYELIPFLSSRIWFLFWAVLMAIWAYFIYKDFSKIPVIREEKEREKEYKKYIP